ncbi:MAG: adenylosuccinate synthase [Anaerolineae bacterium]|nr:adenylosuccinate synthase [Thermoflexales bacterium]MDW8395896.1 adenylosuccinate synthase [Anaerolineae bacterium]
MSITVLLGAQWGDEGKGRITDALAAEADLVARFNGGDNAGHSITIGARVVKLHLIPSGILREGCLNVIGNGVVVNPINALREIAEVRAAGVDVSPRRLRISQAAHVILPGHLALDAAREAQGGIGTTKRGIGPAYSDKVARLGVRAGAMADPRAFGEAVRQHTVRVNRLLEAEFDQPPLDADAAAESYAEAAEQLRPFLDNTFQVIHNALRDGLRVLAEGAQATLLDIDHGTYPFVTSSNATVGGVLTGLGVPPQAIRRVIGVCKAFTTRVGGGPFVTELEGELALRLRGTGANPWDEYGTTTGRPRRVGWLDLVALRYAVQLNGITELALTKLDVLCGLNPVRLCTAYRHNGETLTWFPQDSDVLAECAPIYEDLPGWSEDVRNVRRFKDLPVHAQRFVERVESLAGAPVRLISVGPEREQLIWR